MHAGVDKSLVTGNVFSGLWQPLGLRRGGSRALTVAFAVLPLSISFVTFTILAYVIDVFRGRHPEQRTSDVAVFITFFPHLIAGPIVRAHELLPQVPADAVAA